MSEFSRAVECDVNESGFMECKRESVLVEWDDGYKPSGSPEGPTKMAMLQVRRSSPGFFSMFENVLPPPIAHTLYDTAVTDGKPWGVYVTLSEAAASDDSMITEEWMNACEDPETKQKAIAACAVKHLFLGKARGLIKEDFEEIHGAAVWCLSASQGSKVPYHIDYAELHRYETNEVFPPLYGGVMHLTPVEPGTMEGGDFAANLGGLDHYKAHGYKGKLSGMGDEADFHSAASPDWVTAKYKFNRGMVYDGDLPHLSTEITHIPSHLKRVILGFNLFTHEVGECAQRAPEHSQKFNTTVKLYQSMATAKQGVANKEKITLADIKRNPALYKMLKLVASKMKEKNVTASKSGDASAAAVSE